MAPRHAWVGIRDEAESRGPTSTMEGKPEAIAPTEVDAGTMAAGLSPPPALEQRRSSRRLGKQRNVKKDKSNLPANSAWRQQRLPHITSIPTPRIYISLFGIVGVLFVIIGISILTLAADVNTYSSDYTDCVNGDGVKCSTLTDNVTQPCICEVDINVTADMEFPVSLYYGMHEFYQNHRRYIRNRLDAQYRYVENFDLSANNSQSRCSEPNVRDGKTIVPCGAIARSYFNDSMTLWKDGVQVALSANGIALASDVLKKYRNPEPRDDPSEGFSGTIRPLNWNFLGPEDATMAGLGDASVGQGMENQDWIIWMRVAAFPNWKKLYRNVVKDSSKTFSAGEYKVRILYNYPSITMGARKNVYLVEGSTLGGRSTNLAIMYLFTGISLCLASLILGIVHLIKGREMGNASLLYL